MVLLLLVAIAVGSTVEAIRLDARDASFARGKKSATEKLRDSYLAQARAQRRRGSRTRFDSLEAIRKAAAIQPSSNCDEAIASLALTDVRLTHTAG